MGLIRSVLALAAIVAFQLSAGASSAQDDAKKRIIGTWRLVNFTDENGQPTRGPHPTGLIFYDALGNMAVQIMPDRERPKFAIGKATPEQAKEALTGYTAYFGTYSVDEKNETVTHHRTGNLTGNLGGFVRRVEFIGPDKLILRPLETKSQVIWERVK